MAHRTDYIFVIEKQYRMVHIFCTALFIGERAAFVCFERQMKVQRVSVKNRIRVNLVFAGGYPVGKAQNNSDGYS